MRSRPLDAGLSAALLVGACSRSKQPAPSTRATQSPPASSAPAPLSVQAQLQAEIRRHGVNPGRATQLFSLVVGPLPGVSVPAGDHAAPLYPAPMRPHPHPSFDVRIVAVPIT
jgi:hypothetical protein